MDGFRGGGYHSSHEQRRKGGPGRGGAAPPYELVFGPGGFETRAFPRILAEIELRGADVSAPERFLRLESVTALLRELAGDAPGVDVYGRYGALLYHAWHFWRFDRRVFAVEETLARRLVESTSAVGTWQMVPPHPAGYMQLPRHLFWARVEEGATPEPVDGFFWTMPGRDDPEMPPFDRLDVLLVLGMRPGRPGFGSIPVGVELSGAPPGHWADADGRPSGDDFANLLPGGELHGWYGLVTELEVLKLVSRIFRYIAVNRTRSGSRWSRRSPGRRARRGGRARRRRERGRTRRRGARGRKRSGCRESRRSHRARCRIDRCGGWAMDKHDRGGAEEIGTLLELQGENPFVRGRSTARHV